MNILRTLPSALTAFAKREWSAPRRYFVESITASHAVPASLRTVVARKSGTRIGTDFYARPGFRACTPAVSFGPRCWVNRNFVVDGPGEVTIGADVVIGPDVRVYTSTHPIAERPSRRAGDPQVRSVSIGDGVWIGARVTILPGLTIGAGSVIAAGAVVASDVPANTVVGGVPAKVIRDLAGRSARE